MEKITSKTSESNIQSKTYKKLWKENKEYREWMCSKAKGRQQSCIAKCYYEFNPDLKKERSKEAKSQWKDPVIRAKMIEGMKKGQQRRHRKAKERSISKRINDYSGSITISEMKELSNR